MRMTKELKKDVVETIIDALWPEGWHKESTDRIVAWLSGDGCGMMAEARRMVKEHPLFVERYTESLSFNPGVGWRSTMDIRLPFTYAERRCESSSYTVSLEYRLTRDGKVENNWGAGLPEDIGKDVLHVLEGLRTRREMEEHLEAIAGAVTTLERFLELVPKAAGLLEGLTADDETEVAPQDDSAIVDDINRKLEGIV